MEYKIVVDSCCELPEELKNNPRFERVALGLEVDGEVIMDDDSFDQASFLSKVAGSPKCPKSFCPSPQQYMDAFDCDADTIFVFTLSSKLSGSFNSAQVARHLFNEQCADENLPKKRIFVCDSKSASGGETQLVYKALELIEQGLSFSDICVRLMYFRNTMRTYFVLDTLDTFVKNGRISAAVAAVTSTLKIKPVMASLDGDIIKVGQGIGLHKAYDKMIECMTHEVDVNAKKTIIISHCNTLRRALEIKSELEKIFINSRIIIMDTMGVSSMYANDGGVIVTI